ncbi:MAG: MBL fold metallo-hydrolase, partial [Planctomycetes bacterium]|nr:MBL fold metallo-hydrolase [Planctomycetota bacterium]
MSLIEPKMKDDDLLSDIQAAKSLRDHFHLWWLGQSGFLIQWQGHHLLLDPYLSDSLTKKYAQTDKPHVRMTELVIDPRRLDFVDVVTSSHNHTDHLDGETLIPLLDVNPQLIVLVPEANRLFVADRLDVPPDRLTTVDDGGLVNAGEFTIHAVPAAHEDVERDENGRCRFLGYVIQFGEWTVYHSGDTVRYTGMAERLCQWSIDVALLPINGHAPERRVPGNLWGREAAELARDI